MHFPDGGKAVLKQEWRQPSPADHSINWKTVVLGR
jgi:hypothetical protein